VNNAEEIEIIEKKWSKALIFSKQAEITWWLISQEQPRYGR